MEKMLVSPSPQIRDNISTSKVMTHVLIALCPALAMSAKFFFLTGITIAHNFKVFFKIYGRMSFSFFNLS